VSGLTRVNFAAARFFAKKGSTFSMKRAPTLLPWLPS
jgi:hypothetical protein